MSALVAIKAALASALHALSSGGFAAPISGAIRAWEAPLQSATQPDGWNAAAYDSLLLVQ